MKHAQKWLIPALLLASSLNAFAAPADKVPAAIENGLRYLESVQTEYGEFPTTFTPNLPDQQQRQLNATYDSNVFTTAMLADALYGIKHPRVDRIQEKTVTFLKSQLNNSQGLWSYFTTHNPKPLFPRTIYDLDCTAFASMVLQQNNASFPDNRAVIKDNKDKAGLYLTWRSPMKKGNDVDCGVNANVLSYLQENDPKVCAYLNEQVIQGKNCAWYYTQMDAYYLIARAYASGVTCLEPSVSAITSHALKQFNRQTGNVENSPFKTAVALNVLLDVHYTGPEIQQAKEYLLKTQSANTGAWPAEGFWLWATSDKDGNLKILGRSGSSALTTALVLKALNKI
jgi:hypothetical protein